MPSDSTFDSIRSSIGTAFVCFDLEVMPLVGADKKDAGSAVPSEFVEDIVQGAVGIAFDEQIWSYSGIAN